MIESPKNSNPTRPVKHLIITINKRNLNSDSKRDLIKYIHKHTSEWKKGEDFMIIDSFLVLEKGDYLKICVSYDSHTSKRVNDINDYFKIVATRYSREGIEIDIQLHNAKSLQKKFIEILREGYLLQHDPKLF
jgi:hypothetical protein